jgi:hypothetical protein
MQFHCKESDIFMPYDHHGFSHPLLLFTCPHAYFIMHLMFSYYDAFLCDMMMDIQD